MVKASPSVHRLFKIPTLILKVFPRSKTIRNLTSPLHGILHPTECLLLTCHLFTTHPSLLPPRCSGFSTRRGAILRVAIWQTIDLKAFLPNNVKDHVRLPYQFPVPNSQLIVLIIHGASNGSRPRNDGPFL